VSPASTPSQDDRTTDIIALDQIERILI